MIKILEDNLHKFKEEYWSDTEKLVNPYLELTGETHIDKVLLAHISEEVKRFNEKMHEEKIKEVMVKAEKECKEYMVGIPVSYAIYKVLKEMGYLKSYEEWGG